ncbi:MAG: phospholipid/cholesterol/gamma-HCH transport system ATP-binding protein [Baekduia sp.]|jgi:phospholipid/cholesterol/gamma-HCH transport system ATP-binding protein|nr:phospholipid/cholesterol/gamma-HCH transport system ATP-binding protein [Baekduia sp.]
MAIPAVELIDVHTALGGTWVLRGVNFGAPAGRITALLGPSGVGKTTCIRHITGLLVPDRGDVIVGGRSRANMRKDEHTALARRFGVLLQGSGMYGSALWGSMTILENLMFQLRSLTDLPDDDLRAHAFERLREVGLAEHADMLPSNLSAGMCTRAALARALVSDPEFAVLDSFDEGVDPVRLGHLCELIRWHHDKLGGTYLIATHDMEVTRRLADHVVVLWDGQVIEEGPTEQVFSSGLSEVRQFVTGATEGPLTLHSQRPAIQEPRPSPPGEAGMHIPIPLATAITLVVVTGSVLKLGSGKPIEVVILAHSWVGAAVLLAARHARSR